MKLRKISEHLNKVNSPEMNILKLAEEAQELSTALIQSITRPNKMSDAIDEAADLKIRLRVFEDHLKTIHGARKQYRERLNNKSEQLLSKRGRNLKHEFHFASYADREQPNQTGDQS